MHELCQYPILIDKDPVSHYSLIYTDLQILIDTDLISRLIFNHIVFQYRFRCSLPKYTEHQLYSTFK